MNINNEHGLIEIQKQFFEPIKEVFSYCVENNIIDCFDWCTLRYQYS